MIVCLKEELHNPEETRRTRTWKPGSCSAELSEIEIWKLWHYFTFMHSFRPTYLFKFWFPILISIQFKLSYACKLIKCNFKIYISKGSLDKNGGIPSNLVNNNCSTDWFYSEKWYVIWFFKGPFLRKLLSVNNSAVFLYS